MATETPETPETETDDGGIMPGHYGETPETETPRTFLPNVDPSAEGVLANLWAIRQIDGELAKVAGTVTAKSKAAVTANELLASTLATKVKSDRKVIDRLLSIYASADVLAEVHPLIARSFCADIVSDLESKMAQYQAEADGLVRASLKASSSSSETTTTLLAQRSAIVGMVGAMSEVLRQQNLLTIPWVTTDREGADVEVTDAEGTVLMVTPNVTVPTAPKVPGVEVKAPRAGGTKAPKVSKSSGQHYVLVDGAEKVYGDGALSLLAFRIGVPTADLKATIAAAKLDTTAPWTLGIEAKGGTVVIGFRVTPV